MLEIKETLEHLKNCNKLKEIERELKDLMNRDVRQKTNRLRGC